jgi:hypothetical protein
VTTPRYEIDAEGGLQIRREDGSLGFEPNTPDDVQDLRAECDRYLKAFEIDAEMERDAVAAQTSDRLKIGAAYLRLVKGLSR